MNAADLRRKHFHALNGNADLRRKHFHALKENV